MWTLKLSNYSGSYKLRHTKSCEPLVLISCVDKFCAIFLIFFIFVSREADLHGSCLYFESQNSLLPKLILAGRIDAKR